VAESLSGYHILQIQENRGRHGFPLIGGTDVIPPEFWDKVESYFRFYHNELITSIDVLEVNNPGLAKFLKTVPEDNVVMIELPNGEHVIVQGKNAQKVLDDYRNRELQRTEFQEVFIENLNRRRTKGRQRDIILANASEAEKPFWIMLFALQDALSAKRPQKWYIEGSEIVMRSQRGAVCFICELDDFYPLLNSFKAYPLVLARK
jgi:hypothetical protein